MGELLIIMLEKMKKILFIVIGVFLKDGKISIYILNIIKILI